MTIQVKEQQVNTEQPLIHHGIVSKGLLTLNIIMALIYFFWWFWPGNVGNPYLYGLLLFGEFYHVVMALSFWFTLWPGKQRKPLLPSQEHSFTPSVAIFIPVAGEPKEIVKKTVIAAKNLCYPDFSIYILNDGYVTGKDNWQEMVELAKEQGVQCITRTVKGGAKAGNLNHALKNTRSDIVVILDADMVVLPEFLDEVIPYFYDPKVGFVQTPQYYANHPMNEVTRGAWEQQEFFFGPIMKGKEKYNASFICGTNVAIRRTALEQVGGMNEQNIAEDFLTSLAIHQNGWKSYYLTKVYAVGLAPEDLLSYFKQQLRWARGSLEVLFGQNPLIKGHLTFRQKIQYLSSALYYFNGAIVVIDAIMPLIFLFTGIQPVASTTTTFALFFVPFMFLNLLTLHIASMGSMTFRAISFTQSSFVLQLVALKQVFLREKSSFVVTPKNAQQGNFLFLAYPHIIYLLLIIVASYVGLYREGFNASIVTNIAWGVFNIILFLPYIQAAYPWKQLTQDSKEQDSQYNLTS